jgi:protein KRI1
VALFQDDDKPQWADEIDITDLVPDFENELPSKKKKKKKKNEDAENVFGAVDVDRMDASADEGWDGTEETRKGMLDQYMDEIYELDFNDMVCANSFSTWLTH